MENVSKDLTILSKYMEDGLIVPCVFKEYKLHNIQIALDELKQQGGKCKQSLCNFRFCQFFLYCIYIMGFSNTFPVNDVIGHIGGMMKTRIKKKSFRGKIVINLENM